MERSPVPKPRPTIRRVQRTTARRGFSLPELLITVLVMAILAGAMIPYFRSADPERLTGIAETCLAEFDYARNLAVTNNSKYRLTFSVSGNKFYLEHSGTNSALASLPPSPYDLPTDPPTRHTTDIAKSPIAGVKLFAVVTRGSSVANTTTLEFNPLGNTTAADKTEIWFVVNQGANARYISVTINPVTGLTDLGAFTARAPTLPSS